MEQINGVDCIIRLVNLPDRVRGFTVVDIDGLFNIYINQGLPYHAQVLAFHHEMQHIFRDDFFNRADIQAVEA